MINTFQTSDFYSSAFLLASGVPLQETYKQGSQTVFVFEESDESRDLLSQYFAMQATVNASGYAQSIKNLKNIIHADYSNSNQHSNYENKRKETE